MTDFASKREGNDAFLPHEFYGKVSSDVPFVLKLCSASFILNGCMFAG